MPAGPSDRSAPPPATADALVRDRLHRVLLLFREIAAAQPGDGRWLARIAETHRALGETHAAVVAYREAAQTYMLAGHDLEALSACTLALRLSPNDGASQRLLESLVASDRTGTTRDAPAPAPQAAPARDDDEGRVSLDQLEFARMLPARHPDDAPAGVAEFDIGSAAEVDTGYEELSPDDLVAVTPASPPSPPPAAAARVPTRPPPTPPSRTPPPIPSNAPVPPPPARSAPPPVATSAPARPAGAAPSSASPEEDSARLRRVPLLGELPSDALELLVACVESVTVAPGDRVVTEGEVADRVYVVVRGDLVATRGQPARPLARLSEGAFFGEMALLDDTPRSATVTAVTDAELLALPRTIILEVCERHPAVLASLLRSLRARLIATLAATSPLFAGLAPAARTAVVSRFRLREIDPGTDVIRAGAPADGLYIVLTGRADVLADDATLASLTTGDVAGELALLSHGPSEVTVRARSWVTALVLPAADLDALTAMHPPVLAHLARVAQVRRRAQASGRHDVRSLRRV